MVDYIKIYYQDKARFESFVCNPENFEEVDAILGLHSGNVKYPYCTEFSGMEVRVTSKHGYVRNSIHKAFNEYTTGENHNYNDFNYFRGNIYTKNAIDENGNVKVTTPETMEYDTLPNGKIVARKYPGELVTVPVDKQETHLRLNFSKSDNRNYRDGDKLSLRYNPAFSDVDSEGNERRMYNSPVFNLEVAQNGSVDPEYDRSSQRRTLINDEVRVYKGGSWKDRDYWLDPAQRRYLPQYMATNYIGFRCAMSRVGSKFKKKNKRATH